MTKLQAMRKRRGMTQAELSKLTNLSLRTIQEYEQGHRKVGSTTYMRLTTIAGVLNCTPGDIIGDDVE